MGDELREDIAAAKAKMKVTLGSGKEIKRLEGHLQDGELVERMSGGTYNGTGLVVITDRRILFVREGIRSATEDYPWRQVTSVQWGSGLTMGTITIHAGGAVTAIKNVSKAEGKELVDLARQHVGESSAPAPATVDHADQLRKLGELRDAGILSDEEFSAKKAEILARM